MEEKEAISFDQLVKERLAGKLIKAINEVSIKEVSIEEMLIKVRLPSQQKSRLQHGVPSRLKPPSPPSGRGV